MNRSPLHRPQQPLPRLSSVPAWNAPPRSVQLPLEGGAGPEGGGRCVAMPLAASGCWGPQVGMRGAASPVERMQFERMQFERMHGAAHCPAPGVRGPPSARTQPRRQAHRRPHRRPPACRPALAWGSPSTLSGGSEAGGPTHLQQRTQHTKRTFGPRSRWVGRRGRSAFPRSTGAAAAAAAAAAGPPHASRQRTPGEVVRGRSRPPRQQATWRHKAPPAGGLTGR
jgi:hypothetical protein